MKFVALAIAACVFLNCATIPAYDVDVYRIHIFHENQTFDYTAIYLLNDGLPIRRIIRCPGLAKCQYWLPQRDAERVLARGQIELGWRVGQRHDEGFLPGRPLHGQGQLAVWDGMTVVIKIGNVNTWIYPGAQLKQAGNE